MHPSTRPAYWFAQQWVRVNPSTRPAHRAAAAARHDAKDLHGGRVRAPSTATRHARPGPKASRASCTNQALEPASGVGCADTPVCPRVGSSAPCAKQGGVAGYERAPHDKAHFHRCYFGGAAPGRSIKNVRCCATAAHHGLQHRRNAATEAAQLTHAQHVRISRVAHLVWLVRDSGSTGKS